MRRPQEVASPMLLTWLPNLALLRKVLLPFILPHCTCALALLLLAVPLPLLLVQSSCSQAGAAWQP